MEGTTAKTKKSCQFTQGEIDRYLDDKLGQGVSPVAVAKYITPLQRLLQWLQGDKHLTADKLTAWRKSLETHGYSKITVQSYVKVINDFLRSTEHKKLCIPKPMRSQLEGRTFGYLTVLEPTDKRRRKDVIWLCRCKCGKEVEVPAVLLKGGNTTSCGCLKPEILQHANRYQEGTELRQAMTEVVLNPNSQSGYVGVQPKRGKWTAYINYKGVRHNLGTYSRIEDAVKARARAKEAVMEDAARIYKETDHLYGEAPRRPPKPPKEPPAIIEPVIIPARRSNNTSGYPGVTKQHDKWSASISVNKYRYRLGAYEKLEDAIAARKQAEELVKTGDIESLKAICTNWQK